MDFNSYLKEQLDNDAELKREFDALKPEYEIIRSLIGARNSQNLTQKELADRTGMSQADISKLENGERNPTLELLKRLADGLDMFLDIRFVPKSNITKR